MWCTRLVTLETAPLTDLTPWYSVFQKKLIGIQLIMRLSVVMESKVLHHHHKI
jgi:hypothetical protein